MPPISSPRTAFPSPTPAVSRPTASKNGWSIRHRVERSPIQGHLGAGLAPVPVQAGQMVTVGGIPEARLTESGRLVLAPGQQQVAQIATRLEAEEAGYFDGQWLSELKLGIQRHDAAFFGNREEDGFNINAEVLFKGFQFMEPIGGPRPHVGLQINTSGDTNQLYFGLSWEWEDVVLKNLFAGFALGFVLHDGKLTRFDAEDIDNGKEFGLRMLFREALEVGYAITPNHRVSMMLDHISNGNLADNNEGLDTFGFRYGYRF